MSKIDFEEFLKKHENKPTDKEIDWEHKKQEWLDFIKEFYKHVESWLVPFKNNHKLTYKYKKTQITEEYIGTYDVDVMVVDFAGQKLTLEPIGTLLIGTNGRIDMEGTRGRVQFILADKDSEGIKTNRLIPIDEKPVIKSNEHKKPVLTWKIVLRESRNIKFAEFTEDNFFDALMEVVNG